MVELCFNLPYKVLVVVFDALASFIIVFIQNLV
jgi:hypothetical protein